MLRLTATHMFQLSSQLIFFRVEATKKIYSSRYIDFLQKFIDDIKGSQAKHVTFTVILNIFVKSSSSKRWERLRAEAFREVWGLSSRAG